MNSPKQIKIENTGDKARIFFTNEKNIIILAVISTLLWGSAYPSIKIGYQVFQIAGNEIGSKILFAGYRFAIAGMMTLFVASFLHKKIIISNSRTLIGILLLGFIQTCIQYIFFYIGLSHTTGVKGSILNATGTFFAVILAHFFYKNDKMDLQKIIGCATGFIGILIINLNGISNGRDFSLFGEGFILLAALSFAVGSLISKKITCDSDSMIITGYQLFFGGIVLILIGLLNGGHLKVITISGILLLLYMAGLSSIAFTLWTTLLKYNKLGKISVFNFLVPIFGAFLSALFLNEPIFKIQNIIALICVCIGIYIVNKITEK